jgi:hypothetical protein
MKEKSDEKTRFDKSEKDKSKEQKPSRPSREDERWKKK